MQKKWCSAQLGRAFFATFFSFTLVACSSTAERPKPAELTPLMPTLAARQVWVAPIGPNPIETTLSTSAGRVAAASAAGTVALVDVASGADVWRASVGAPLTTGAGTDGHLTAVVTVRNELVALVDGKVVWQQRLPAAAYTAPLVAGQRVFVLSADRTVSAFDGNTGARLWAQSRTGEPLVLRQPGVLLAVGDTLVTGLGGRLLGLNPSSGAVRWDVAIASPRGANDIERMVDLVGPAARFGNSVCVRAFQAAIGCVDAQRGVLQWTQPSDGRIGLHGDERTVFATENNGRVVGLSRQNGQRLWVQDALLNRGVGAPLVLGRSLAVADAQGWLHLLSREDGSLMARLPTDGSPVVSPPVLSGDTLLTLTRSGNLFAWRPQ